MEYRRALVESKSAGKKVAHGFLQELINKETKEFGVSRIISKETIRTHLSCGTMPSKHQGVQSPLAAAEVALVAICIQMGKTRQPLSSTEAVRVMNDLIDGIKTQEALVSFQTSRKLGSHKLHNGKVTTGWWRGFLKSHGNEIFTKRGERFALNRDDWTTFENIQQMYDVIYDELVNARVAFALSEPIFTGTHANVVDDSC